MKVAKGCFTSVIVLSLSACAVSTVPITEQEFRDNASLHLDGISANPEPLTGPVDLYDVMARALKYNLDYRVEKFEHALRIDEQKLTQMEMLPDIVASADLSARNNDAGGRSISLQTGTESLEASTSSNRNQLSYDLGLSWNILDFGLSYVRAKQDGDRVLIAYENRRRVANKIIEDVRTAYWRAVSSEKLIKELENLESVVNKALQDSKRLESNGSSSPIDALRYQREMLSVKLQIKTLHKDFAVAKKQLAALINVDPGAPLNLKIPKATELKLPENLSAMNLVRVALSQRPEMRELAYELRISEQEATAALVSMLPRIELFAGINKDTNALVYNNNWQNWGASISWNLLNAFSYPSHKDKINSNINLMKEQSRAMAMAIATQVHISLQRFKLQSEEYGVSKEYSIIQSRIDNNSTASRDARRTSNQNWIRERMNTIVAHLKTDIAYASLQNVYANVFAATGHNSMPIDSSLENDSVNELAAKLRKFWNEI